MIERFVFYTKIQAVTNYKPVLSAHKEGDDVIVVRGNDGWFITLEGSHESIGVGIGEPHAKPGQRVKVILEIGVPDEAVSK